MDGPREVCLVCSVLEQANSQESVVCEAASCAPGENSGCSTMGEYYSPQLAVYMDSMNFERSICSCNLEIRCFALDGIEYWR